MGYSTVHRTGNVADIANESESLLAFAGKNARRHFLNELGSLVDDTAPFAFPVHAMGVAATPLVFGYYAIAGPLLYQKTEYHTH